jgi:DNA-binding GntR family transcriptional regulator
MRTAQSNQGAAAGQSGRDTGGRRPVSLPRVSTVAALTDALRQRILDGEFPPRTALREVELAEDYGVARHSVRAAMQALAHSGLLTHAPNRGMFVPEITQVDITDLFRLRTAIEAEAVTVLAETGLVTQEVEAALARLASLPADAPWSTVIGTDLDFHREIVQSTGSSRLDGVFAGLQQEVQLCLIPLRGRWQPSEFLTQSHRTILDMIRRREPIAVAAELRAHVDASRHQLQDLAAAAVPSGTLASDQA